TSFLLSEVDNIRDAGLSILFESDLPPSSLARFIEKLPADVFGINYDTGNSASLGYSPIDEFSEYGHRIKNVHIKDRKRNGGTVELGNGDTDFRSVFNELSKIAYSGNLILQTARANDHRHAEYLARYKSFTEELISEYLTESQI
ncbi:MAG: TIM barrel protein, partial [Cyanobacteriota bacterium]|nr:TIM barrel protein [Cyanobacteriota bacterium]